ncbi:MAG: isopeptide-forming domain-containing fimbrial protein, partial [Bacilli bacterium]|nr:isopeptide-forming domain-containing fimbrial protein [Bacilli bacterium]
MNKIINKIKNKKFIYISLTLLLAFLIIRINAATLKDSFKTARENAVSLKTSGVAIINGEIPKEYEFVLYRPSSSTAAAISGRKAPTTAQIDKWAERRSWSETYKNMWQNNSSVADSTIKGNYSVTYTNVGTYKGSKIDVKATVMDFEAQAIDGYASLIKIANTWMGNDVYNVYWVRIKYEFFKAGTTTPISVKGYTSYYEVDGNQGILLDNNNTGIYITSDNLLSESKIGTKEYISAKDLADDSTRSVKYGFTETFTGTTITRTFNYSGYTNTTSLVAGGMYHSISPVVSAKMPTPTKEVNKNIISKGEEFTYTITQKTPSLQEDYYYKSLTIEDTFEKVLEVNPNDVQITNELGTNVTNRFNISITNNKLSISPIDINYSNHYGHTFSIAVKAKTKDNADLSSYRNGNYYIIPNKAKTIYKDYKNVVTSNETQTVNVKVKVPVKVNYEIVTEENPPASLTDPTPGEENKLAGEEYTAKGGLTTTYTDKRCTFKGWYTSNTLTGTKYTSGTLTNDLTLYGGWTCDAKVEVNYHLVGENTPDNPALPTKEEKYVNDTYTAKPGLTTTYKDKKCTFNGWYTNSSLTGTKYTTGTLTGNLDLYGKWDCVELIKTPTKQVSKENIKVAEEYTYTIKHEVPNITDSN